MIIKNHLRVSKRKSNGKLILGLGLIVLLIALLYGLSSIPKSANLDGVALTEKDFTLIANAEEIKDNHFVLGDFRVPHPGQQSSDYAYEGDYSFKLKGPHTKYGLTHDIENVHVGDYIVARVWIRPTEGMRGCITIKSFDKNNNFYVQASEPIAEDGEWKLIEAVAEVNNPVQDNKLRIFCYNTSNFPVYFDNLRISRSTKPIKKWKPEEMHLFMKNSEFEKLEAIRTDALEKGVLMTTDDSWIKGAIFPKDKTDTKTKVDLRLKGDWLDHLKGDKWSFRVKTETNKSWNRLKTFSLQDPNTRSYLKEWLLHELFSYEDVLTTRYDFVTLKINHKDKGLYVYEEHFLKQIPEYNLRREGPIVKFTENGLWEARLNADKYGVGMADVNHKANPDIRPFGEGKTLKSENLANQFKIAQNLCYEYQYGLKPAKDIFDLDLMAKYYVVMDLMGAHHGVIWHNQRFYYNPVIGKLEPIGFDGYDEYGDTWVKSPFLGFNRSVNSGEEKPWHTKLFMDIDFLRKYYHYLNIVSDKKYINTFIDSVRSEMSKRWVHIKDVHPSYQFSTNFLYKRAQLIKEGLSPTSASLHSRTMEEGKIALCNYHNVPVEVIGAKVKKEGLLSPLDSPVMVYTCGRLPDFRTIINVSKNAKYLVCRIVGLDSTFLTEINPWPIPKAYTPMQELVGNLVEKHPAYYYDKSNKLVIFKDSAVIDQAIIIPEDHQVTIEAGSYIDIIKKGFVISYSAVNFMGNEEGPIVVNSSDGTANGFTVIKAKKMSYVFQTRFQNMNTLAYKTWNLTGAVTFYESDVEIQNSTFTNNHCEDALNIIRSKFLFNKSTVSHTFSDGFDADFCEGTVSNSYFLKTGNDGVDFSTSKINIINTTIKDSGDKGISIGEQGTAIIVNTKIDGANIGIASKDLSVVTVRSVELENCTQGFAAYQKKPEYGGGKIFVKAYTSKNITTLHKILPGSYLKLITKEIKGN